MAPKGYPGLVVVPPSDRRILRRQLAHWAFIIFAVAWSVSASKVWVPSSDNNANCQSGIAQIASANFPKGCGQPGQSETETRSHPHGSSVVEASQGGGPAASHGSVRTPSTPRLVTQPDTLHKSKTNTYSVDRSSDRKVSSAPQPPSNPGPDAHLAEQGDAFAQYRLGRFYAQIRGPHAPESVSWYVKASAGLQRLAKAGNGQAMYVLGVMYAYGRGVAKDEEQARLWLTKAVDQQVPDAQLVLARLDGHRNTNPR